MARLESVSGAPASSQAAAGADALSSQLRGLALGPTASDAASGAASGHGDAADGAAGGGAGGGPRVVGMGPALQALRELVGWPLQYAAQGKQLGVRWPRGVLLHGPPGCGKTLLVQCVAKEYGAALHCVSAANVFGAYVGESERKLREAFEAAASDAAAGRPAIVFLDEVDALCPRRDGQRQHEARVVAQLLTLLDGACAPEAAAAPAFAGRRGPTASGSAASPGRVVVVGATNRPNALDPALRRPGRLDREIAVPVPGAAERHAILSLHTRSLPLAPDVDLSHLAAACHGYSGADLAALAREAAMYAFSAATAALLRHDGGPLFSAGGRLNASFGAGAGASGTAGSGSFGDSSSSNAGASGGAANLQSSDSSSGSASAGPSSGSADINAGSGDANANAGAGLVASLARSALVSAADFTAAMRRVGPSIVRGAETEFEPVGWDAIGGLEQVKQRLRQAVEWPLKHADAFQRLGLSPPRGVLLHGPPGCSKTTLARAAATASGATFMSLSCAQLYNMYVGEGEAALRDAFKRARMAAPSIIFLDEIDAVAVKRSEGDSGGSAGDAGLRLLASLLTEMDGMELATGVLVLAATNRPGALDSALLRPGRFDVVLYVPPPDAAGRLEILRLHTAAMPLAVDVDLEALAGDTEGFTGAELAGVCREAAIAALREDLQGASAVAARHFAAARAAARAALTKEQLDAFAEWGKRAT